MKKTITVKSTQSFFDNLISDELFTCREMSYGLKVKYNDVFTPVGNPSINIYKLSEAEVQINITANPMLIMLSLGITVFFWAIAFVALYMGSDKTAGITVALLAPSVMWIYDIFFMKQISKIIMPEIENRSKE